MGFFQRFWLLVGELVKKEVKQIFTSLTMPEYLNRTLITLIPKCSNPKSISNYRLISLCNFVYKIVTKLTVARIRPMLSDLISPYQTAFVPGRKGVDNAVIVQKLIHSMSRKKGRGRLVALKIDLEQAYDRLEWSFIRDTLGHFKLANHLISLIMSCVSTSSISILYNGGALESFLPSRGIRQGDPLSPYFFILCMKVLGALITKKCDAKLWDPIKASKGGLAFSHLFFLYAKADRKNCMAIRNALDSFCSLSGQKVSNTKSKAFFAPNVSAESRAELCEILGFKSTPMLGKYLGFPIKHSGMHQDFGFVIERIQKRLTGWKANLLSFAGRLVLTQSVITTVPDYVMQCVAFPAKVLSNVDKLSRNFLWGLIKKKFHLVSWQNITKSKLEGGLGIHATKPKNIALLAKLNGWLKTETSLLWSRVLNHKYRKDRRPAPAILKLRTCSNTWSMIRKGEVVFKKRGKWVVGNNS